MNIAEILLRRAAELGDSAAIVDVHRNHDRSYSFRELDVATCSVADQLRSAGLKPGDGVLLLHPVAVGLYPASISVCCPRGGALVFFSYSRAAQITRCACVFSSLAT